MREGYGREVSIDEILPLKTWEKEMTEALETIPEEVTDHRQYLRDHALFAARFIIKGRDAQVAQVVDEVMAATQQGSLNDSALAIARGIYDFIQANFSPRELEQSIREYIQNRSDETINELLHYSVTKDKELYLHVSPAKTLSLPEQLKLLREGLPILAKKLKENPNLQNVETIGAVSWIVAANPGLLTRIGFTYKGNLDEKRKAESFPGDTSDIGEAYISREDFLKRYLKE